jgi:hypothetical protein
MDAYGLDKLIPFFFFKKKSNWPQGEGDEKFRTSELHKAWSLAD